jgi:hypothetical protein
MLSKKFTYVMPDIYGGITSNQNRQATATYNGPEQFYVKITENGYIESLDSLPATDDLNAEFIQNWADTATPVLVDAEKEPVLAYLVASFPEPEDDNDVEDDIDDDQPGIEYFLEGETEAFFEHDENLLPDEIFDVDSISYDAQSQSFRIPFLDLSKSDDADYETKRLSEHEYIQEFRANNKLTREQNQILNEYLQEVDDVPNKYKDYPSYMWPIPDEPDFVEGNDDEE